ncbi:MAG: PfkB family carbohydrate kinase [Acidimicrobiales bacterium]
MTFVTSSPRFDVVSLGDVATDTFIRLPENIAREHSDESNRWLEIPLGAKFPYDREPTTVIGGSGSNTAVALARLGLRVGLASFLAHDHIGLDLLNSLHAERIDTRLIHVDSTVHTNQNFVLLFRGERTILVRHEAFEYHWPHLRPSEIPAWLYLSSLGPNAFDYQDLIADWLEENPRVKLAFQPGTYQIGAGVDRLARLYARADVVLCSESAAAALAGTGNLDHTKLLDALLDLGCRCAVVWDERGAGAVSNRAERYRVPPFPDSSAPLDRTGVDDAFGATFLSGLIRSLSLRDALRRPPVNVMSVSHELGSQPGLLTEEQLAAHLDESDPPFEAVEF